MSINRMGATWAAGEIPSAAKMRAEIQALWDGLQAPWDTYTPVWSSTGTQPTLGTGAGAGTLVGSFLRYGQTIVGWRATLTFGSGTNPGSGQWSISLPSQPAAYRYSCLVDVFDVSATSFWTGTARTFSAGAGSALLYVSPTSAGAADRGVGSTTPFAWAAGDVLTVVGTTYEIAGS